MSERSDKTGERKRAAVRGRARPKKGSGARQLRFTREGRVFVLVTLGVGAAAVNTGNNLLYLVLGLLLSLIVLSGVSSEIVLRKLRVERRLPKRAFAGSACLVELVVKNEKRHLPSYSIELEDVAPAEPTDRRCYFLKVAPRGEQSATYHRIPGRRGVLSFGAIRVRTRYPFGLFEKTRVFEAEGELVVYPALAKIARVELDEGHLGPDVQTRRRGHGAEVTGLREYADGDDARAIHWRRTASLDRVVVRDRQRDAARRVTLLIDEQRPPGAGAAWDERFERVLSEAAGAAARAIADGAAVRAVARSGASPLVLPGQAPDAIWRFLALLEPTEADAPLPARIAGAVQRFEVDRDRGAA